ncbi:MAG TPA: hypothetical protein VIW67_20410, partial [Terriglobales bacterium]
METFRRRCEVTGSVDPLPDGLQEEATRRLIPLTGRLKERVPDFFRRGNRFLVEVSWSVERRGKPLKGTGQFRYPIGYPQTSHESRTGHGVFFNAPVVSDTERHGPARNDPTNDELRRACEGLLLDVFARRTVLKWGPDSLKPLVPSPGSTNQDVAVRPLLAELAKRGALPTLSWKMMLEVLKTTKELPRALPRGGPRLPTESRPSRYEFVIPTYTWNRRTINTPLALLCPSGERQLDPRIDTSIVSLLSDYETPGFKEVFITFDEDDAFSLASGNDNDFFAAIKNHAEKRAIPLLARACLDVVTDALDNDALEAQAENEIQNSLLLPDLQCEAVPFNELHSSVSVPSNIPGL